jgi:uncharacterized protein YdcH (DUF465 family)
MPKFYNYIIEKGSTTDEYLIEFAQNNEILVPLIDEDFQWAQINNLNCPKCKFKDQNQYCNLALNLSYFLKFFSKYNSYDDVIVTVQTDEYTLHKATSAQKVALSILNLLIPFSGCSNLDKLKYISQYHIPFELPQEMLIRLVGNYMVENFKNNNELFIKDIKNEIHTILNDIGNTIKSISHYFRTLSSSDTIINSLILFDTYLIIMDDFLDL